MPRVYGITLYPGIEIYFNTVLKMYDISYHCNVGKNRKFLNRKQKYSFGDFSMLLAVSEIWAGLTQEVKDNWYAAGDAMGMAGYNLFTQDRIYRLKNNIPQSATPSTFHQFKVGHINIDQSEPHITIQQYRREPYVLPCTVGISYKAALAAEGTSPYAMMKLRTRYYYAGKNRESVVSTMINLAQEWTRQTFEPIAVPGRVYEWKIQIEVYNAYGDLWFDDVYVEYGGEIKSRDPYCNEVEKQWTKPDMPASATLETVYPLGSAL